jgi:hypothetical protein
VVLLARLRLKTTLGVFAKAGVARMSIIVIVGLDDAGSETAIDRTGIETGVCSL